MNHSFYVAISLAGFAFTLILFVAGIRFAGKFGLLDKPGGRKTHEGAIPLIGGLVIIPVFAFIALASGIETLALLKPLLGGVSLLLLIGALDDKFHIHPWVRFVIQIWLACYVVVFCDAELKNLGNLFGFGDAKLGWFGAMFSVTCLVLLMNAINMLDGVDGLAGGFIVVALGWLMIAAWHAGAESLLWSMIFLLVPLMGFLVFNARHPFRKKAAVFLGDAGSLSLALILGWFAIHTAQISSPVEILSPVVIIWIMTVPIMDTFAIFFVRMKQRRSPFDADRLHAHYKIMDKGFKPGQVTIIILAFAVLTGAIGYYGIYFGVPEYVLLYSWSAILGLYTYYRLKTA